MESEILSTHHSKKKGRYTINKYRRCCIATDVIVFQQYNELYSKYNELYSKNKNWIAKTKIVLIPPKKCKKTKNVSGRWPSLCCTIIETKIKLLKNLDSAKKREFSSPWTV